ncbi:hypothetical protein FRC01_008104, partial [Tulasnella sp. 417]
LFDQRTNRSLTETVQSNGRTKVLAADRGGFHEPIGLPPLEKMIEFWKRYDRQADFYDKNMTFNLNQNLDVLLIFVSPAIPPLRAAELSYQLVDDDRARVVETTANLIMSYAKPLTSSSPREAGLELVELSVQTAFSLYSLIVKQDPLPDGVPIYGVAQIEQKYPLIHAAAHYNYKRFWYEHALDIYAKCLECGYAATTSNLRSSLSQA